MTAFGHFHADPLDLFLDILAVLHLQFQLKLFQLRQPLILLPARILFVEALSPLVFQMVAVCDTVHAIQYLHMRLYQLPPLR